MNNIFLTFTAFLSLFISGEMVSAQSLVNNPATKISVNDSGRFVDFFSTKTLRVDFVMAGNHSTEKVFSRQGQTGTILGRAAQESH